MADKPQQNNFSSLNSSSSSSSSSSCNWPLFGWLYEKYKAKQRIVGIELMTKRIKTLEDEKTQAKMKMQQFKNQALIDLASKDNHGYIENARQVRNQMFEIQAIQKQINQHESRKKLVLNAENVDIDLKIAQQVRGILPKINEQLYQAANKSNREIEEYEAEIYHMGEQVKPIEFPHREQKMDMMGDYNEDADFAAFEQQLRNELLSSMNNPTSNANNNGQNNSQNNSQAQSSVPPQQAPVANK